MQTVLVAGGAGYVGSRVCLALVRTGFRPVVYHDFYHDHLKQAQSRAEQR